MTTTRPALHALDGAAAPPELAADLAGFARLPDPARARLWEVLGPSLVEPPPDALGEVVDAFCASTGADGEALARVVRAARVLLRAAARVDLAKERFADDLAAIAPGPDGPARLLLAGWDKAREVLRRELAERAILAHGKVLTGVDWRVDTIGAVKGGPRLGQPVVMLTLTYREGDRTERVTLQALPDTLAELGALARAIVRS
jgi:hypothetical protein